MSEARRETIEVRLTALRDGAPSWCVLTLPADVPLAQLDVLARAAFGGPGGRYRREDGAAPAGSPLDAVPTEATEPGGAWLREAGEQRQRVEVLRVGPTDASRPPFRLLRARRVADGLHERVAELAAGA